MISWSRSLRTKTFIPDCPLLLTFFTSPVDLETSDVVATVVPADYHLHHVEHKDLF